MIERHPVTDRDSWLAMRSLDLTASDIGAAVGLDPYKSRLALYAEKTGMLMPQADNASMQRGRWLEAAVLSAYREMHPDREISPANVYLRDTDIRLGATPDAIIAATAGSINAQCKVVSRPVFERDWAAGPPLHYQLQTLAEGMLLRASESVLLALVIDTYTAELHEFPVPRHEAAEARVEAIARQFWDDVAAGRMPPADYGRDAETIAAMFPTSVPEPVLDLSTDNRLPELLRLREMYKVEAGNAEACIKGIDTEIKAKMGEAERATLPGWKLSWKTVHRKESITQAYDYRPLIVTPEKEQP